MKAVILAGGLGKRLRPLTDTTPKAMITIAGRPILLWQLDWLKLHGVSEVVLCVGHLMEKIKDYFGDGSELGFYLHYVEESEALGTGGALKNASAYFPTKEPFLALNGDTLTDLDLSALRQTLSAGNAIASLALVPLPSPFGIVVTNHQDRIISFQEKPRLSTHWINGGVYCFSPEIGAYLPDKGSVEHDVFPRLAAARLLSAYKSANCFWMSIDNQKDIDEASRMLAQK